MWINVIQTPDNIKIVSHHPTIETALVCQRFGHLDHVGVDFNVKVGTNVYAVLDGVVSQAVDNVRVYGRYMTITHSDGYMSLYAHLSAFKVKKGAVVKSGDIIALSGGDPGDNIDGDGWSTAAHLHWEVRVPDHLDNNLYNIDPIKYLAAFYTKDTLPNWIKIYLNEE